MTRSEDRVNTWRLLGAAVALSALAACGGGGGGGGDGGGGGATTYTLGGMVVGVNGPGLVLRNGDERLSVAATGAFTFATRLAAGASYAVSVSGHPANQTCSATNASGTMGTANVTNIAVACVAAEPPPPPPPNTYTIGGEVTGLSGSGLVLTNNGVNDLAITANGAFTFSDRIAAGMPYAVAIATQPGGQSCTVASASGTVGSGHISSVRVNCGAVAPVVHTIGGTVSNLTATGLVLHNNGGDPVTVPPGAASFAFAAKVTHGGAYNVTVATQPGTNRDNSQDCSVARGSGTADADVGNVAVTCGAMGWLALLGSSPAESATDVPRTVQPSLSFSSAVDAATIGNSFQLLYSGGGLSDMTPVTAGSVVTLRPTASRLLPMTTYSVMASAVTLRGVRGERLESQVLRRFFTADAVWKDVEAVVPGRLYDSRADSFEDSPRIAVDLDGNAIVTRRADGFEGVLVSRYTASSRSWSAPQLLSGQSGVSGSPKAAMDRAGNAVVVWPHTNANGYSVIWAARFDKASGIWDTPRVVTHADGSSASGVALSVHDGGSQAGLGRITVAWARIETSANGGGISVWVAESDLSPNVAWQAPRRLDAPSEAPPAPPLISNHADPQIAASPSGHRAIVWKMRPSAASREPVVWARRIDPAGQLDMPGGLNRAAMISNDNGDPESAPRVAVGPTGIVIVVWLQTGLPADTGRVFGNLWMNAAASFADSWSSPKHIAGSGDASDIAGPPAIGLCGSGGGCLDDRVGRVLVAWRNTSGGVFARHVGPDGGLNAVFRLADSEGHRQDATLHLATDRVGNAVLLWSASNPDDPDQSTGIRLRAARFRASVGAWGGVGNLTGDLTDIFSGVGLGIHGATGDALAVWPSLADFGDDYYRWRMHARRFE